MAHHHSSFIIHHHSFIIIHHSQPAGRRSLRDLLPAGRAASPPFRRLRRRTGGFATRLAAAPPKITKNWPKRAPSLAKNSSCALIIFLFIFLLFFSFYFFFRFFFLDRKKLGFFLIENPKNWSFAWKIENRPTYGDFEKKNPDPQLHQMFKPITKFFCTFLLI